MAEDPANLKSENPDLEKQRSWALVPGVSLLIVSFSHVHLWLGDMVLWHGDTHVFQTIDHAGHLQHPQKGAVIFVVAPHHNQFVDPLVLMTSVRKAAGRRVSLLTAAKSYRTWYVGVPARLCSAIPVERALGLGACGHRESQSGEFRPWKRERGDYWRRNALQVRGHGQGANGSS